MHWNTRIPIYRNLRYPASSETGSGYGTTAVASLAPATRSNTVGASYPARTTAETGRLRSHPGLHERDIWHGHSRLAALS